MNKLYGRGPQGNVLACILEPGNIERLKNNQPIEIDLNDGPWKQGLPPKIRIVIAYSETPIADQKNLRYITGLTPNTLTTAAHPSANRSDRTARSASRRSSS